MGHCSCSYLLDGVLSKGKPATSHLSSSWRESRVCVVYSQPKEERTGLFCLFFFLLLESWGSNSDPVHARALRIKCIPGVTSFRRVISPGLTSVPLRVHNVATTQIPGPGIGPTLLDLINKHIRAVKFI